ncbi:MAG: YkgJ family cysteine cluster protein [Desulfosudaceae bacterium]
MMNTDATPHGQGLTVLTPSDSFGFTCHPELDCFTRCCRNITIFLTPYDILRLKNALAMPSDEFLPRFTVTMIGKKGVPLVALKMNDDAQKSCPFVTPAGCSLYPDRPWACRVYPLQPESSPITEKAGKQYYSIMDVPFCHGLDRHRTGTVRQWLEEQGVPEYQAMETPFKKITDHPWLTDHPLENDTVRQMVYMASYDLDRFRRFVFESSFLDQFAINPDEVSEIKEDDTALFRFAMKWLEYGLIGQHTLHVRPSVMAARKEALGVT